MLKDNKKKGAYEYKTGEKMEIQTSGTKTELKTGYIKAKDKNLACEPDGHNLVIYGKREEILNITSVYTAVATDVTDKFVCELSPDTYKGVSFDPPDAWSDGKQIFKYNPDIIAFSRR